MEKLFIINEPKSPAQERRYIYKFKGKNTFNLFVYAFSGPDSLWRAAKWIYKYFPSTLADDEIYKKYEELWETGMDNEDAEWLSELRSIPFGDDSYARIMPEEFPEIIVNPTNEFIAQFEQEKKYCS